MYVHACTHTPPPDKPNAIIIFIKTGSCDTVLFERHWVDLDDSKHFWNTSMQCLQSPDPCLHENCKNLGPKYVYLPQTLDKMKNKEFEIETKFGMIQVFGCIDGTHISIKKPIVDSQDYKQFFSLHVDAVCDLGGLFMDVDCRWPGCVHDANVFANSNVHNELKAGNVPTTFNYLLPGCAKIPNYLIGDSTYPLTPNCTKDYKSCKTNSQVISTNLQREARNPFECALDRLKASWCIPTRKMDLKSDNILIILMACFVLHNFCEIHDDNIEMEVVKAQMEWNKSEDILHKNIPHPVYSGTTGEGEAIRETLIQHIHVNLPHNY